MPEYHVRWEIDLDADTPEEAAAQALKIQRDPESIATAFEVVAVNADGVADFLWGEVEDIDFAPEDIA